MDKKDYYEVLGVSKQATQKEIKSAYRKLAKEFHPDRNKSADAEAKFKQIQEAYDILNDTQKRNAYDRYGHAGTQGFGGSGFEGFDFRNMNMGGANVEFGDFGSLEDIFEQFFGASFGGMRNRPRKGQDIGVKIKIPLKDAVFGIEKEIQFQKRVTQNSIKTESMKIKIPAGIPDDAILRFEQKGHAGINGGPFGDLLIQIEVELDDTFERRGADIYLNKEIDIFTAVLGGKIEVKTVHGESILNIPQGLQPETVLRMTGFGGPKLRGKGKGDQYVRIFIKIPKKINKKEKELWEELAKTSKEKKSFVDKIFG